MTFMGPMAWRWRGIPLSVLVGGLGVLVLVVIVVAMVVTEGDGEGGASGLEPFYLEAEITVVDRSGTAGTNLPSSDEGAVRTSYLRWWYRDATHARWELPGFVGVLDGDDMWFYDEERNTYTKHALPDVPAGTVTVSIPGASIVLGPVNAAGRDDFIQQLKVRGAEEVAEAGEETVLGRRVTIIEMSPASRSESQSSSGGGGSSPTATPVVEAHGTVRYWLDEERMFVLRYEVRDPVMDVTAAVTRLDYPADIPDDVVTFEPPPGAEEAQ